MGTLISMTIKIENFLLRQCWSYQLWWDCSDIKSQQVLSMYFYTECLPWISSCHPSGVWLWHTYYTYWTKELILRWAECRGVERALLKWISIHFDLIAKHRREANAWKLPSTLQKKFNVTKQKGWGSNLTLGYQDPWCGCQCQGHIPVCSVSCDHLHSSGWL